MITLLADTHAVIWYLFEPAQLSAASDAALTGAVTAGAEIGVSAISVIEVRYLVERFKLPASACDDLVAALCDPAVPLELVPIDLEIATAVERIPRAVVPDMPDRVIAATALVHGVPLVTRDAKIRASPVRTIW
jgi:PIN domain nuclease of toxin-antitoxin system